ncbi:TRAP transporter small permease [Acidovorax sp. CCYZU-2555]|uniref:TRAP transporter small permease n=1 Tax=Acidovorax sp. CCYZU-2555 TaxID=2835042 RepID=UPI0020BE6F9B|nr:TRAP transporter small permease [Acidovorax sp. CCYZU-2555]
MNVLIQGGSGKAGPGSAVPEPAPPRRLLTRINAPLAKACMIASVAGLLFIVVIVFWQVFGRYVLNSSPTWTESLSLIIVLYVTLLGAAVGVRDAGHIGLESLLVLAPDTLRQRIEFVIHALVAIFGAAMVYNGLMLGESVISYKIPNLALPEAVRYAPLVLSGLLIILFSIEHIVALIDGTEVEPSWH